MRLFPHNHVGSSHWDGGRAACIAPDQIGGKRRTSHCGKVVDARILKTVRCNPLETGIHLFSASQVDDRRYDGKANDTVCGIEVDLELHADPCRSSAAPAAKGEGFLLPVGEVNPRRPGPSDECWKARCPELGERSKKS